MASKHFQICLILVLALALMLCRETSSQSKCSNNMINSLSTCITYLRGNSSKPLPSCCSSLASVVQSQPECVCPMLLSNGATSSLGVVFNRTLATTLPAACQLRIPQCDDVAGPASAPSFSPPTPPSDASSPLSPAATAPAADFPSGTKTVTSAAATKSIYLTTVTLMTAASILATFHFQH